LIELFEDALLKSDVILALGDKYELVGRQN